MLNNGLAAQILDTDSMKRVESTHVGMLWLYPERYFTEISGGISCMGDINSTTILSTPMNAENYTLFPCIKYGAQ